MTIFTLYNNLYLLYISLSGPLLESKAETMYKHKRQCSIMLDYVKLVHVVDMSINWFILLSASCFGTSYWRCIRSPFRRTTGNEKSRPLFSAFLFSFSILRSILFFTITTFSHRASSRIKKLIAKVDGSAQKSKNRPFGTPSTICMPPGGHFRFCMY